jgi:hypothetical protein
MAMVGNLQMEGGAAHDQEPPPVVVLQCAGCRSIVSDTLEYYVTSDAQKQTITVSDARLIRVAPEQLKSQSGWDRDCCFQLMSCATCRAPLGRVYTMTTPQHARLNNNYTFATEALVSYQLGSIEMAANAAAAAVGTGRAVVGTLPAPDAGPTPGRAPVTANGFGAPAQPAPVTAAGPNGGAIAGGREIPALNEAVAELDEHVEKLTTASNQSTQAHLSMAADMKKVRLEANALSGRMQGYEEAVDKMQNMFLVWEERFKDLETRLQAAEAQSIARQTLELRFDSLQQQLISAANGLGAGPHEPFVRQSPTGATGPAGAGNAWAASPPAANKHGDRAAARGRPGSARQGGKRPRGGVG